MVRGGNKKYMSLRKSANICLPFILLVVTYALIIHTFFDITKIVFIKYVLIQCFVIMVPGMVFVKFLFADKEKSVIRWISLSYSLGYAINIFEYIIIWGLKLQRFATIIVIIGSVIAIVLWFCKPIELEFETIKQDDYIILFLFLTYLMINIFAYSGNNISPFVRAGISSMDRDALFWCDNAVAMKNSFLPQAAYFSGTTFYYHYFSSIHIAFISQVSGISIFDLSFTLFSFGKCILLVGALNYLIERYKLGSIKYLFYLCILFMTGWEINTLITYQWHLTYNPFGYDIGFAYGIWLVAFVLDLKDDNEFDIREYIAVMLIWVTLVGVKGPIAALLILIPGLLCFSWLFKRKYKLAFGYGLSFLGIFALINFFCVGIVRILNHTAEAKVDNIGGFRSIYGVISETPFETRYRNFIPSMFWVAFNTHPVLFVLTLISTGLLIWLLVSKRMHFIECGKIGILLFTMIVGFLIGRFYNAGGHSESYFSMAAYIPWLTYNMEVYRETIDRGLKEKYWMDVVYKIAFLSISIVGLYCMMFTDYMGGIITPLGIGYNRIHHDWGVAAFSGSFTRREAEACKWIRDNTPQDSIVQSNRFISYPAGSFYVGIFSERIQYLEETFLIYYCDLGIEEPHVESNETQRRGELIYLAYEGNADALNQMIDEGVDYFIQDNQFGENKLTRSGLKEVYNKDDIVIYAVN